MHEMYFQYGERETTHLKRADKRLAEVIAHIGRVERKVIPDLFTALVHTIVGQQISTHAHETVWRRLTDSVQTITPAVIEQMPTEQLRQCGISPRKATYIQQAARCVLDGTLDIAALQHMSDEEVCTQLMQLNGIGRWSAEMLLLFSLQRPNVLSYGDLGIRRGLCMVYHHKVLTRELFEKYRQRYAPHNSVAALYLWAVAAEDVQR